MIFNEKMLFLHYPKTGGMMLTEQFLKYLKGQVYFTLPQGHEDPNLILTRKIRNIQKLEGIRHENYVEAKRFLENSDLPHRIENFERVIVIIRNPYDYIVSRFHYLKNNRAHNSGPAARIASEGDFRKYAIEAPRFFQIDGYLLDEDKKMADNLFIVRYEDFATQVNPLVTAYMEQPINFEKRVNATSRKNYTEYITDSEIEEAIYQKFRLLFDKGFYSRLTNVSKGVELDSKTSVLNK